MWPSGEIARTGKSSSYSQRASLPAASIVSTAGAAIYSLGPSNGIYTGVGDGAGWTITATDGGAFTFAGLDTSAVGYPSRVDIVLTGTPEDGGAAIVADIAAVGTAILPDSLASVTLSSLTISGFGYADGGFIMPSGFANFPCVRCAPMLMTYCTSHVGERNASRCRKPPNPPCSIMPVTNWINNPNPRRKP